MVEVSRTVRFCTNARPDAEAPGDDAPVDGNGFAAIPSMHGLGAFYELVLTCKGAPDAQTGYLINIARLDDIARTHLIPRIGTVFRQAPQTEPATLMPELFDRFADAAAGIADRLTWRLTPYYCCSIGADDMTHVQLSQQFEFAAAHRLHVPSMTAEDNRAVFGKCNNEHSHGHNYRVEVAVAVAVPTAAHDPAPPVTVQTLEAIVTETVIDRFDHKNLNAECPEFAELNPSVEHIAQLCFDLLEPPLRQAGAELDHVRIWETGKTACTVARQR